MLDSQQKKEKVFPEKLDRLLEGTDKKQLEIIQWLLNNRDYEEKPVEIEEFIVSPLYLNLKKTIRPRILKELINIFKHNEGKTWLQSPKYNEFIFVAAVGVGKSFASSVAISYLIYQLGCLKDPVLFFKFSPGSKLYLMEMSTSAPHAKNVVFGEIKARIDNCEWFRNRFPYDPQIQSELHFPKGIKIIPGNSSETFFEGYNIFGGVLDEADSHTRVMEKGTILKDFADIGYDAIRGRIKSRFGMKGMLIVIGSPKTVNGFLMTKYKESGKIKKTYSTLIRAWDSPPLDMKFSGKTFHLKGIDIPIEYKPDFDRNPEKAMRDLAAVPSYASEPFFHYPEKVEEGYNNTRHSPWNEISKRFKNEFRGDDGVPRWIHVDLGVKKDATGIAMGHVSGYTEFEGEKLPILYMDLMLRISVPKGNEISIADIRQMIYNFIERKFNVIGVTFDGFQCQVGSNKIKLLNGEDKRIDELTKDDWIYSYDIKNNKIVPSQFKAVRKTGIKKATYLVELDNGEKIGFTAEHPILMRDSTYKMVKELKCGDSLMPLYTKLSKKNSYAALEGYEMIWQPLKKIWQFTHRMVASKLLNKKTSKHGIVHHRDFNKKNNLPNNLEYLTFKEHNKKHPGNLKALKKAWKIVRENPEKRNNTIRRMSLDRWKNNKDYRRKVLQTLKEASIRRWDKESEHIKMSNLTRERNLKNRDKLSIITKNKWIDPEHRKMRIERIREAILKKWQDKDYRKKMMQRPTNHKVVSIKFNGYEDVYDIEVPKYNNMALSSGIFVHNSIESIQQLTKRGIKADYFSVDKDTKAYDSLKEAIYQSRLNYYKYEPFITECVHLELLNGDKVDHQPNGSKDVSDAVAGVVYNLMSSKKARHGVTRFISLQGVGSERIGSAQLENMERKVKEHNKTNKPRRRFYGI